MTAYLMYEKTWHFRTLGLLSVTELPRFMKHVETQWTRLLVERDWISCAGFGVRLVQRCELKKWMQTWRSVLLINIENCSRSVVDCLSCFRGTANTELWFLRVVTFVTTRRSYLRISFWNSTNRWVGLWNIEIDTNTPRPFFFLSLSPPQWTRASSFMRFLDHTQRRTTVGRTPLDEWSARRRDLYLTIHNTHNGQTSMPQVGFEPAVSASERTQTYALDRAATWTVTLQLTKLKIGIVTSLKGVRNFFYHAAMKTWRDETGGRILLGDNLWSYDIYLVQLGFRPGAVVGRRVKNTGMGELYTKGETRYKTMKKMNKNKKYIKNQEYKNSED